MIHGERRSRRCEDEKEAGDAQKNIAAVKDEQIPLLDRSKTDEDGDAAQPGPQARGKHQRTDQKDPEECRDPAIILRHYRKEVDSSALFYLPHRGQRYPGMDAVPIQPVAVEQQDGGGNTDAVKDPEQGDGKRRLRSKEKIIPEFTQPA